MGELVALDLINETLDRLKLARISTILADDPQARQILSFCREAGNDVFKRKMWPEATEDFILEFGAPTVLLASTTASSTTVAVSSSATISAAGNDAWAVSGNGVQIGTRVASVPDATTIILTESMNVTQIADLTFTQDTFDLPADWHRDIPQTAWDNRNQWALLGPDTPQRDQMQRSGIVPTGPRRRMRNLGYPLRARIWPPPSASGDFPGTLIRQYISKYWAVDTNGVRKSHFTANDDVHIWADDEILIDGIRWRYWEINGLPFTNFQRRYYNKIDGGLAASEGAQVLELGRRRFGTGLISAFNIQDGNFPDRTD